VISVDRIKDGCNGSGKSVEVTDLAFALRFQLTDWVYSPVAFTGEIIISTINRISEILV
jgi:hypothetical protein